MPGKDPIQVEYPRLAAKTMKLETQKDGETTLTINETLPFKDITVRDKYHITYITCVMIGLASLLPYTCLLSSSDYFQQHHSKVNNIILQMMTILNIFNFGSIALLIPFNKFISIYTRIYICSIMTAIIFITIFKYVDSYSFILGMSCLCGVSCGTLCTTVIAYAQFFSSKYVQAAFVGQSLSALVGSILRIITKLYCSNNQSLGAMIYFITCASIFILGAILFFFSLQTEFARHHIQKNKGHDSHEMSLAYFVPIFKKLAVPSITIFTIFFVTCTIFPVLIIDIKAYQYTFLNNERWMTVWITFIFAVGDYIARQIVVIKIRMNNLLTLSVIRLLIAIPIAILFYASIWNHDIALFIFAAILALTHGELSCYCFMKYGHSLESNEQETGAAIMEFFLSMAIAIAGLAASFIDYVIRYIKVSNNQHIK